MMRNEVKIDEDDCAENITAMDLRQPMPHMPNDISKEGEIYEPNKQVDGVQSNGQAEVFSFRGIAQMLTDYELAAASPSGRRAGESARRRTPSADVDVAKFHCLVKNRMMIFFLALISLVILIAAVLMWVSAAKLVADVNLNASRL